MESEGRHFAREGECGRSRRRLKKGRGEESAERGRGIKGEGIGGLVVLYAFIERKKKTKEKTGLIFTQKRGGRGPLSIEKKS